MTEIIKTEAIVLQKLDYGETSKIATFYTKDYGRLSAMVKGSRSPKSKFGRIVDSFNHLQIVLYKKESRELQLLSDADLIEYYGNIKSDLEIFKYAACTLELVSSLTVEGESHLRLYKGLVRILQLFNDQSQEEPRLLLIKFMIFFIEEIGYRLQLNNCSVCRKKTDPSNKYYFNFEIGLLCEQCIKEHMDSYEFHKELFNLIYCLSEKRETEISNMQTAGQALHFLEKYLKYHIPEFKGLNSLKMF